MSMVDERFVTFGSVTRSRICGSISEHYPKVRRPGIERMTVESQVQCPNHQAPDY